MLDDMAVSSTSREPLEAAQGGPCRDGFERAPPLTRVQTDALISRHYNAQVIDVRRCHEDLWVLRVHPDRGVPPFVAGQYTVLGLGYWEPRIAGSQEEHLEEGWQTKLVKRVYSISCSLLDRDDRLTRVKDYPYLEFYVALVRKAARPPALTPRLFLLERGDRLFVGPHAHGNYTLHRVRSSDNVVFAATGTGEAPHNAMLSDLLAGGHRGRIASVVCVRYKKDLAYTREHGILMQRFPHYRYMTLTTREPENLDRSLPGYVGKRYLQQYLASGILERELGWELSPANTHIFLCGSPDMIGAPHPTHDPQRRFPKPTGMVEILEQRGFQVDQPHEPGNIHYEKYW